MLSAVTHGKEAPEIVFAIARVALAGLDDNRVKLYLDLILHALGKAARITFEEFMASGTFHPQSIAAEFAEGRVKGMAEARAEDVLIALKAQRFTVTEEQKRRILSCTDANVLGRWLRSALWSQTSKPCSSSVSSKRTSIKAISPESMLPRVVSKVWPKRAPKMC